MYNRPAHARFVKPEKGSNRSENLLSGNIFPRLFIGLMVFTCAEVFSGASLQVGLWHPWTWLVTYWLYFAHFFFFTSLAIHTGKTSIWALYLWGVIFGLYESWITKVIWYGYSGDGNFAIGNIGPYGYSEISMVFIFHPVMSFIVPLAVSCVLYPQLRRCFPDLAWLTGRSNGARAVQIYLVVNLAIIIGMNSGGPFNLALNLVILLVLFFALSRLSRSGWAGSDTCSVMVFDRRGFVGLCIYLLLLYSVSYIYLRPDGIPSIPIQLLTFAFYILVIVGLRLHRERKPLQRDEVEVENRELRLGKTLFAMVLGLGFLLSVFFETPELFTPVMVSFVMWTPLGFVLTAVAFMKGVWERITIVHNKE